MRRRSLKTAPVPLQDTPRRAGLYPSVRTQQDEGHLQTRKSVLTGNPRAGTLNLDFLLPGHEQQLSDVEAPGLRCLVTAARGDEDGTGHWRNPGTVPESHRGQLPGFELLLR